MQYEPGPQLGSRATRRGLLATASVVVVIGLYFIQRENYLVFHGVTELFSIAIAWGIFAIARSGWRYFDQEYLPLLGVAYAAIGLLDLLHTLGYTGMGVFADYDFYANQLWVAARYLESISFLVATLTLTRQRRPSFGRLLSIYAIVSGALIYSIFFSDIFPAGYVAGVGQTPFKVVSEFIINGILLASLGLTIARREHLQPGVYRLVIASLITTIIAEVAFTFYVSNYGISNMLGHYAKVVSFYLIYRAVIVTAVEDPYQAVFTRLSEQTRRLADADTLNKQVFSVVSHDLRSVFTTMRSFCGLMDGWEELSRDEMRDLIRDHSRAVERGSALVTNLLDWARDRRTDSIPTDQPTVLASLVDRSIEATALAAELKDVALSRSVPESLVARCDPDTIGIAIQNLLSNAVKFSHRGEQVEIIGTTEGKHIRVAIVDHGVGIDPAVRNNWVRVAPRAGLRARRERVWDSRSFSAFSRSTPASWRLVRLPVAVQRSQSCSTGASSRVGLSWSPAATLSLRGDAWAPHPGNACTIC